MYTLQPLMYKITRPVAKIDLAKMAVKTSFVYAVAVIVFTGVCDVYGQQGATPAPCNTSVIGDYQCNDGNGCYSDYDKCDSFHICADRSDDSNCDRCIGTLSFYCVSSRQCVLKSGICDGLQECLYGEDENVTICSIPEPCRSFALGQYRCKNGIGCYSDHNKCDSNSRCGDKSDDLNCDSCTDTNSFYCVSSRQCVSVYLVCNGHPDCLHGEDENVTFCSTECTSGPGYIQCNDGIGCYADYDKCNSYNACNDKSDDLSCDSCTDTLSFYCQSSRQCVSNSLVCNGQPDCLDGEDEYPTSCSTHCTSGYGDYQCKDGNGCYSDYNKCDTYNACDDKTDDLNCNSCGNSGAFYCVLSRQCVSESLVCDGHQDCRNGEDENLPECYPTIWMYWSGGQMAGIVIGYVLFLVIVIAIIVAVHKNCKQ